MRSTPAGDAYLHLQSQARRTGRPTQELFQLYALEGFLARLADGDVADRFVLKGGVLLAAFDSRRPTRDIDLAAVGVANNADTVLGHVRNVMATPPSIDDGIEFRAESATAEAIREEADYSGVRVHIEALLASAKLPFHIDVTVGDPIWPSPVPVLLPRLRGGRPISLRGYPIHMVHAEKIVTAIQRGTANTRWRDFGDMWSLSRQHNVTAEALTQAVEEVASHRKTRIRPLAQVLDGYADLGQARWRRWRIRSNSDHLPEEFALVLKAVIAFADPILSRTVPVTRWQADTGTWLR